MRRAAGFTLLEVLVVVALVALISAVAIPLIFGGDDHRRVERMAGRVVDLFDGMGEQSLFLSEFLAVRLEPDRLVPMRFDPAEERFEVFTRDMPGAPETVHLGDGLILDWSLESPEQRDDRGSPAADEVMEDGDLFGEDDEERPPQLFFFPSGESTAARITLESTDRRISPVHVRLGALGHAHIEEEKP